MLRDDPCQRSQRAGSSENDEPIDHDIDTVGDDSAMPKARTATLRNSTNQLERCPHCGNESIYRWGKSEAGVPRGRCRGCERTFSPRTGTWMAGVREVEKFACVLDDMLTKLPSSCRHLADVLAVDKMTVWDWRRRISQALLCSEPASLSAAVETNDEPIRESRKGSREWVDHHRDPSRVPTPNRPRWVDVDRHGLPLPHALVAYQLRVLITADARGCRPIVVPFACPSAARHICDGCATLPHYGRADAFRRSTIGLDSRQAGELSFASAMDPHAAAKMPAARSRWFVDRWAPTACAHAVRASPGACDGSEAGETAAPASSSLGTSNDVLRSLRQPSLDSLAVAFRGFLRPFASPAAKYLVAYAAWFIKRLEGSDEGRLERAWMLLMAGTFNTEPRHVSFAAGALSHCRFGRA